MKTMKVLRIIFLNLLQSDKNKILLYGIGEEYVSFIYLSVRTNYVEGSDSSTTGFVEGIARKLLIEGEQWLKGKGCK